ncbi:hypothetical protein A3C57_00500 [Candidatus Nomurabacteria bacterium RIFCSPHIGHO2_02_FULL_33_12]|uniref:Uncharacterized protein n=1 Tax=Candidatus Nomurabacteria bacterium RIFCSPLOWO2_01_FULL_33_17 TaxID=1801764 RepID=A0A1F6WNM6_9BACT|nr:MAG: hypothetical protein A3C57_00500 [Candidatus Nomurabacteria bacterium RIFCSPHIGHO2_02_FULL_33_12]OGI83478.1 MAG: hypothetical protein A2903_01255 [Candidatus Nomurabacteria bacterium RIFCSPLOWO2_01_FULL_33_17]
MQELLFIPISININYMKIPSFLNKLKNKKTNNTNGKNVVFKKIVDIDPLKRWKQILFIVLMILISTIIITIFFRYALVHNLLVKKSIKEKVKELQINQLKQDELRNIISEFRHRQQIREQIINPDPIIVPVPIKETIIN